MTDNPRSPHSAEQDSGPVVSTKTRSWSEKLRPLLKFVAPAVVALAGSIGVSTGQSSDNTRKTDQTYEALARATNELVDEMKTTRGDIARLQAENDMLKQIVFVRPARGSRASRPGTSARAAEAAVVTPPTPSTPAVAAAAAAIEPAPEKVQAKVDEMKQERRELKPLPAKAAF